MTKNKQTLLSESIIQFYEKLFSWETAVAKNSGLTPQQNHTIEIVGNDGPIRMKPLAEKLSVTMGTLTVMVDRLEKTGYVQRQKDPEDGRGFIIDLTDKGQTIHHEHHAYHLKLVEDITHLLDPDEVSSFLQTLIKINGSI
ncbi:MAG: MarR family transcriptional regulator [Pseudomonadota bacterium]